LEFPSSSLSFHPFKKRKIIFPFTFISLFSFHSFFLLLFSIIIIIILTMKTKKTLHQQLL
jgi:hypothetical protein